MGQRSGRTFTLIGIAAALALGSIGGVGGTVAATDEPAPAMDGTDPEKVLSHFLCYRGKMGGFRDPEDVRAISVDDGWINVPADVGKGLGFCNPVRKKKGDEVLARIVSRRHHLKLYDLMSDGKFIQLPILVDNQFGPDQAMTIYAGPGALMVPSRLLPGRFPKGLDHFVCHDVLSTALYDLRFKLRDEFRNHRGTDVIAPMLYCSSSDKSHDGRVFERRHPDIGLACYTVDGDRRKVRRRASNQFEKRKRFVAKRPMALCVPSTAVIDT